MLQVAAATCELVEWMKGGKKREFLGATVDLTPEKNRATPDVDRGLTDFSPANSEIGEEPAFV